MANIEDLKEEGNRKRNSEYLVKRKYHWGFLNREEVSDIKHKKRSVFIPKDLGGFNITKNCNISYKVKMIMKNKFCPLKVLLKQVVRDLG